MNVLLYTTAGIALVLAAFTAYLTISNRANRKKAKEDLDKIRNMKEEAEKHKNDMSKKLEEAETMCKILNKLLEEMTYRVDNIGGVRHMPTMPDFTRVNTEIDSSHVDEIKND